MLLTLLFIAALHWIVLVTPGANVLVVSQLAASGHRAAACFAGLGVAVVAAIWSLLAILGVNAVFAAHPGLRLGVQVAGGVYLCYVAFKLWRSGLVPAGSQPANVSAWQAFRTGFLTNVMNPKSALFFGSVFATALPADTTSTLSIAAVVLVFITSLIWHTLLAFAFSHRWMQAGYARHARVVSRLAAALVGAFGLRFLFTAAGEARAHQS